MVANIYEHKHYKLLILVPLVLMLVGIYFIPHIQLDASLKGGINVQLQTNSSMDVRQLTEAINAKIPGAQASVSRAPAGISITIATNASIANGETALLAVYGAYGNYSSATLNITSLQAQLSEQPNNATLQALLSKANASQSAAYAQVSALLGKELAALKPFVGNTTYNTSSMAAMLNSSKSAYSLSTSKYESHVVETLKGILPFTTYSYNEVTPTLGAFFLDQMINVIVWAFILVAIAVFIVFRSPVPSFVVVFGAMNDIIVALGIMGILGIPLGIASIGGLLMLIGYSIDTDMLTAIRVIKRTEGTPSERAYSTMKTGITMTAAAILSFGILFIVSYAAFVQTYFEISSVVLGGLAADILTTWFGNMPMILWHKQRKEAKK